MSDVVLVVMENVRFLETVLYAQRERLVSMKPKSAAIVLLTATPAKMGSLCAQRCFQAFVQTSSKLPLSLVLQERFGR